MRFNESSSSLMLLALLAVMVPSAHAEDAAEADAAVGEISMTGCVQKGIEAGCWVLTDEHGKNYSFTDGSPALDRCYVVTGSPTMGFCMQGTQIAVETIEPSETDCCDEQ